MKTFLKNIFPFSFAAIIIFACFSECCFNEVGPYINLNPKPVDTTLFDTTYISSNIANPQTKNVLIEDFTGVNCPNCPKAASKLHDLQAAYPGRIVGVALHPEGYSFTEPFAGHRDFRINSSKDIYDMLGKSVGLPAGGIDRVKYSGEQYTLISFTSWQSYVDQRLTETTPVNISVYPIYNKDTSDVAKVRITVHYTSAIQDTQYLTVFLTESHIIDWQKDGIVIDSNYEHNHVIRACLTDFNGDELVKNAEQGRTFVKEFKVRINPDWVGENCSFVAFIHKRSSIFHVVHAVEAHLD